MSTTYTAYTIIGVRVKESALYQIEQIRNCGHSYDLSFRYCPFCGERTYSTLREPVFNEFDGEFTGTIGSFHVVIPIWGGENAFIARYVSHTYDVPHRAPLLFDMAAARHEMRVYLEPMGLWNEEDFGLWTVLGCS